MKNYKEMVLESSLSRLWGKTQKHVCGCITAFRGDKDRDTNLKNNKEVLTYLQGKGYSITAVKGSYIENFGTDKAKEVSENTFFVANQKVDGDDKGQLESDLVKLGRRYDQDSILMIPVGGKDAYLVGTNPDNVFPKYGKKETVGSGKYGKTSGEFLSRIRGRAFAFEDVEAPQTINGLRGAKMFAAKIDHEIELAEGSEKYTINHKTFSAAVQHAWSVAEKRGYEIDADDWDRKVALGPKKPSAGKTNRYIIDLKKNGKDVNRRLHMQVYYDEGRYELNMYIQ